MMALSPMMQQYLQIKGQHEDAILFFRLGDFYEMFYDDAKLVSRELDLTLTGKLCGDVERAPMCGVPYHSADIYIGKLVDRGYKVVICEQTEDPATTKGLVKREVVRIITPGTVTDTNQLSEGKNNYLASICINGNDAALCFADVSTGELRATVVKNYKSTLVSELSVYMPKELISNASLDEGGELYSIIKNKMNIFFSASEKESFDPAACRKLLVGGLKMTPEEIADCEVSIVSAIGALCAYISETQKIDISYFRKPEIYSCGQYLEIDASTRRNLELCETLRTKEKKGTLLWVLDKTHTSLGARMLRKWIEQPLINSNAILERQSAVQELFDEFIIRDDLAEHLRGMLDLERLMTKVVYGSANAKDMRAIANTIGRLPEIKKTLALCKSAKLSGLYGSLDTLDDIFRVIDGSIVENPPFSVREGGFIADGVNGELDKLRDILQNSKKYLDKLESDEKEKTGIKNMKIGYNRVFGYYIEVSKSNLPDVPERYIRKQTLSTGERYITDELKQLEATILGATDKINAIEFELFTKLRELLTENVKRIQDAADIIAETDVYRSLAEVAYENGYTCPEVDVSEVIDIKDGRHPVVEKFLADGEVFVPNDTYTDTGSSRLLMITGPNMAGKSTYMRQVAIICVMAQIGSFVPAKDARIGIVDKLFTRIGASDDLARGQSTFMLEMSEVAYILKNATRRSLIIYDEIGRGTSTFDGMSIARAVAEYTAGKKIGARTLFATHYHELTELEATNDGIVNYSITARKKEKGIVFLRKIVRGAADDSYGIEVAQLAGVPNEIVKHAKEILAKLESESGKVQTHKKNIDRGIESFSIDDYIEKDIAEKLRKTDVETLTPIEALNFLYELKKML
ncbi:MAG: DNA mismatch repair protein MutS [Clostridia bacterium]|nr:DNA mismatch repair protein MutS [Clostridia bacterium]MBR3716296.1 DNA mismatch repair protein MutS [Clostridia bacterium]